MRYQPTASHLPATVATVFLVIIGAWAFELVRNFDRATQSTTVPVIGTALQLGEAENEGVVTRPAASAVAPGGTKKNDDD